MCCNNDMKLNVILFPSFMGVWVCNVYACIELNLKSVGDFKRYTLLIGLVEQIEISNQIESFIPLSFHISH